MKLRKQAQAPFAGAALTLQRRIRGACRAGVANILRTNSAFAGGSCAIARQSHGFAMQSRTESATLASNACERVIR
jgi:hypothetical protein